MTRSHDWASQMTSSALIHFYSQSIFTLNCRVAKASHVIYQLCVVTNSFFFSFQPSIWTLVSNWPQLAMLRHRINRRKKNTIERVFWFVKNHSSQKRLVLRSIRCERLAARCGDLVSNHLQGRGLKKKSRRWEGSTDVLEREKRPAVSPYLDRGFSP